MNDLRYAVRTLSRRPGFTAVVVLTLGLGIGLSTAMFSFADALLFKPPAGLANSDRLVIVGGGRRATAPLPPGAVPAGGGPVHTTTSAPTFFEWRDQQRVFSHLSASTSYAGELILAGRERAEIIGSRGASSQFFETLGVPPLLGRSFRANEERAGSEPVVILTHRFWQRRFGGDPSVLGTTLRLSVEADTSAHDGNYTIVGVLPAHAFFDRQANDVWLPLALTADDIDPGNHFLQIYARLKPDVTPAQASADMQRINDGMKRDGRPTSPDAIIILHAFRDTIVGRDMRQTLLLLIGAVAFILLITCTNVANLMMAHYARTRKDVAIRLALGAGQSRLVRQFVTESLVLSCLGGVVGLGAAFWLVRGLVSLMPATILPQEATVAIDLRGLLFTSGIAIVTGLLFGVLPAWRSSRVDRTLTGLKTRSTDGGSGEGAGRLARHALLITEVALTVMLVIGSALLFRSLVRLLQIDPGFRAANTIALAVKPDPRRFTARAHALAYQDAMLARIGALPGVASVAMSSVVPLTGRNSSTRIARPDVPGSRAGSGIRYVSPAYFSTMGIAQLRGRLLSEDDTAAAAPVIVINETLATFFWPNQDPIGRQLFFHQHAATVVGIVADVRHQRLTANAINEFYIPFAQAKSETTFGQFVFVVRTTSDAAALTGGLMGALRGIAAAVDKDVPLVSLRTMDDYLADQVSQPRFTSWLFGIFGGLSLVLAAVGIYGVLTYVVSARTREFGIRLALGAQRRDVFRLVLTQGLILASIGVALGAAAGYAVTRLLASALVGVTPHDPPTYLATVAIVLIVALLACWTPARRATAADPMVVLRGDG